MLLFLSLVALLTLDQCFGLPIPFNQCSNVFKYETSDLNEIQGVMIFKNDFSGSYRVELNMTIPIFTNQNLGIKRITSNNDVRVGADLVYYVSFPVSDYVPEVTSVVFNQETHCALSYTTGEGTFLTAFDFFSIPVIARRLQITTQRPISVRNPFHKLNAPGYKRPMFLDSSLLQTELEHTTDASISTVTVDTKASCTELALLQSRYSEEFECGIVEDTQPLVVHGAPTLEAQYPWLVAMFHLLETGEYKFKCAGNLISNEHVLTAAHCVRKDKTENLSKENIILVMGKHNIRSWAVRSEIRDLKQIFVHPDYRQPSDGDIAILLMYKPVQFTDKIRPVCLWREANENIVGGQGTVVGWGRDEFFSQYVSEPNEIKMPVVSQEDCLRSDERFIKLTSNRTFCAGARNGSGVCTGDSGGGFIMKQKGRWTLRGIVSAALVDSTTRSCDLNNYMVFADIAKYKLWIDRILSK
ncbi:hypothetical protein RI129_013001 [Pyrocoelia pectoralis]|uniref:Peptidase S1 domain-containing protein n=1 Tax=Pyrocoelia pectoralis TaxID=417401 RepID=A0AAN7ZFJ1_9COLE